MTDSSNHNDLEPSEPSGTPPAANADTVETPATGTRTTRNRKLAIVGGAAAVIGLGAIAAPVVAQTINGHDNDRDNRQEQFEQDLAQKLGAPQSKVEGTLKQMQGDRLGQRLEQLQQAGVLTAEQATAIKAKLSSGDVKGALQELRSSMMTTQLDALIAKDTVTQAQADQIAALQAAGVPIGIGGPGMDGGPGMGRHHGADRGGDHGMGGDKGGDHGFDGPPPMDGGQSDSDAQNGQYETQSFGADGNA